MTTQGVKPTITLTCKLGSFSNSVHKYNHSRANTKIYPSITYKNTGKVKKSLNYKVHMLEVVRVVGPALLTSAFHISCMFVNIGFTDNGR